MRRRAFVAIAAAAMLRPVIGRAQQANIRTIGVLVIGKPDPAPLLQIFRAQLAALGYVDGQNLRIVVRSAAGDLQRLPELAAALAHEKVDVVATWMTPAVLAAKQATSSIPIVMIGAADPVGMGIVASLARPGVNVTGSADLTAEFAGKIVELLKEMLPAATRIGALGNEADPFSKFFRDGVLAAGKANGVEIAPIMVTAGAPLDAAFPALEKAKVAAAIIQPSLPLSQVAELAVRYRLATACPLSGYAQSGGLMSYASDPQEGAREAAVFVDKILKGANPADLPVEQPTKFELAINLKTAKAIGLTIPATLLDRADEVIE
jgi:putative tryptophan/tyrosine transport system substrate-binding protein